MNEEKFQYVEFKDGILAELVWVTDYYKATWFGKLVIGIVIIMLGIIMWLFMNIVELIEAGRGVPLRLLRRILYKKEKE